MIWISIVSAWRSFPFGLLSPPDTLDVKGSTSSSLLFYKHDANGLTQIPKPPLVQHHRSLSTG
jgi:hypothetical protein